MTISRRHVAWYVLIALLLVNIVLVILLVYRNDELRVSFLNVGQGDAILIQSPSGVDVLIDGGRDRSAVRELPKKLGVLDRSIDVVIATHPDADHIGGLTEVFDRYQVRTYMDPGVTNDTSQTLRLLDAVGREPGLETIPARRGQRLTLGEGVYADILYPDRDVSNVETNTGSIVLRLVYGETEFLLTGDAPSSIENWLVTLDKNSLQSDVLKAGHHGSRTSTSDAFLRAVAPSVVVVSAGKDNSYGHPHEEVVNRILASGARILSTAEEGTIEFVSDGTLIRQK